VVVSVLSTTVLGSLAATGSAAGPAASGAAPATSSVAPTAPYTAAVLSQESNGNFVVDSALGPVTVQKFDGDSMGIQAGSGDAFSSASVSPKFGEKWVSGTTRPLTNGTSDGAYVYLTTSSGATSCVVRSGTLTVLEAVRDGADALTALALDWTGTCDDTAGTTTAGQFRWNSSQGYSGLAAPFLVDFPQSVIGRLGPAQDITFTARGSAPVVVGSVALGAPGTPNSVVTNDGCTGKSLADGQTCVVKVAGALRGDSNIPEDHLVVTETNGRQHGLRLRPSYGRHGAQGSLMGMSPTRVLDTRSGLGARKGVLGARSTLKVKVTNQVPSYGKAQAVVLTLTAVGTTAATYLTAYPSNLPRPTASSLNAPRGFTGANTITVRPDATGYVTVYNNAGSTHVIADVLAYYEQSDAVGVPAGGDYHITMAQRIIDSRTGFGRLRAGYYVDIDWKYPDSANLGEVRAYALNVTATSATGPGYLTAWSGSDEPPLISTVNFAKGKTSSNTVIAPAYYAQRGNTYGPGFALYNGASTSAVHFIIDIVGVYTETGHPYALRFTPLASPTRILDSRKGLGASTWTSGATRQVFAPSPAAGYDTWAVVGNATVVAPTAPTFMTFFEPGTTRPPTSNVNAGIGEVVSNGVVAPLAIGNVFNGYNNKGTANALFDAAGRLDVYPASYAVLSGAQTLAGPSAGGDAPGSALATAMAHLPRGASGAAPQAAPAR
jgi:hypothetical protein